MASDNPSPVSVSATTTLQDRECGVVEDHVAIKAQLANSKSAFDYISEP